MAIDYSVLTEEKILKRMRSLPANILAILNSPDTLKAVWRIGREHRLDEERIEIIFQLVGLVLMGFIAVEDLAEEINKEIGLTERHSLELQKELNEALFSEIRTDLARIYEPLAEYRPLVEEIENPTETRVPQEKEEAPIPPEAPLPPEPIKVELGVPAPQERSPTPKPEGVPQKAEEEPQPFILHKEEEIIAKRPVDTGPRKGFSFSLGRFFGGKKPPPSPPKAKVEIPDIKKKKEAKRVVHYGEHRTPLENVFEAQISPTPPETKKEPLPNKEKESSLQKGPEVEGNVVDLSKLGPDT